MMMKKIRVLSFPLLTFYYLICIAKAKADSTNEFIKSECQATRYPILCIQSLSNYANTIQLSHHELARTALNISLTRAQSVSLFISKMTRMKSLSPREYQASKDCLDNMKDTIDQLQLSVKELRGMSRYSHVGTTSQNVDWHVNNVLTWVSTALTKENTCLDGFSGSLMDGNVKIAISSRVLECVQVTSNALVLVNRYAAKLHN